MTHVNGQGQDAMSKREAHSFPSSMLLLCLVSTDRKEKLSILQAHLPAGCTAPMPSDHRQVDHSMSGVWDVHGSPVGSQRVGSFDVECVGLCMVLSAWDVHSGHCDILQYNQMI